MPLFYPPLDFETGCAEPGKENFAERSVLEALSSGLDDQWHVFHDFNWREIRPAQGERIGEADLIIFHPQLGIVVIEVKGGEVRSDRGKWYQTNMMNGTEREMKMPPLDQARRNRYYLETKLKGTSLGQDLTWTALTHAAWFPDIPMWTAPVPPEAPNSSFILCERHLNDPEKHIRNILQQANPHFRPWDQTQTDLFIRTLCPDVNLLVPLGTRIGRLRERILRMTENQVRVFRALRNQKRLLVEGCAGSGKTLLAIALAREHLKAGKRVLFTCYNKRLAAVIALDFKDSSSIDVIHFHELARILCMEAGIPFDVPQDRELRAEFFQNQCAGLIMDCADKVSRRYDTIIVDEAFDFRDTWWLALESLCTEDFSFYAFYDRNQSIFNESSSWKPPFEAEPVILDRNVRNTSPIGKLAARIGKISEKVEYGVDEGIEPRILSYSAPCQLPALLLKTVKDLMGKNKVLPDDIVVLSPYKLGNERVGLEMLVREHEKIFTTDMATPGQDKVRVGTIQAFKGLEADVVILCGIDGQGHACSPPNLYVGATRARSMLYIMHQNSFVI